MIDLEELKNYTKECPYIQKQKEMKSKKKLDEESLSFIINRPLSQSESIRLGIAIENYFRNFIGNKTGLKNIKKKNSKGQKEKDILFIDYNHKIIYYSEIKTNLNLDTEKSKSTYIKCQDIVKELQYEYKDFQIKWCLLGARYINCHEISEKVKKKYIDIKDNLFGINEFFQMFDIDLVVSKKEYKELLNHIADECFDNQECRKK